MHAAIAILGLSFILTFSSVGVSEAELWVCSQPGGGTLFTDMPQTEGSCQKHEPMSQLNYAPPINWANVPPPDATYEWRAVNVPDAQWESRSDEQETVPSDASGGYSPEQSSFWGDDQNPVFTFYSYTPGFYGVPYLRHRDLRSFSNKPRTQHQSPLSSSSPPKSTQTPSTHFAAPSIRPIGPGALTHLVPATSSPHVYTAPGLRSTHSHENPVRTVAPGAPPHSVSPASSTHGRESSVAAVAAVAPAQSSLSTSPANFREHSGGAGIQGAPPQSVGFRQDTKH